MPRSSRYRLSTAGELPATLLHSSQEAQEAFRKAREDAIQAHGEGDEAHRAAYRALKRKFEKRGDQWIARATPGGLTADSGLTRWKAATAPAPRDL